MLTKRKYHRLGKRQLAVITDMFDNGLTKSQALQKNKVGRWLFRRWMANESFVEEYDSRIEEAMQQNSLIIARTFPQAAKRLAELITSEKDETARKADAQKEVAEKAEQEDEPLDISAEKASRMLAILAEDEPEPAKTESQNPNHL